MATLIEKNIMVFFTYLMTGGPTRSMRNGISLSKDFFNYKSGQPNKLTFFAKSLSGPNKLRVKSGDGTSATFTISDDYRRYEIVGSIERQDDMLFVLERAGTFYLDSVKFGPWGKDKRIQIGQVIPCDFLDWLQYFSIDYYLSSNHAHKKPPGSVKLNFIAESIGGRDISI